MQHKSLFAAMMVGALVLASCVKNQESQSVTDVRNARADEIKSQAELNRASAQAAVTLANAEATIAAAQAELLKAQAAKETAEKALIEAKAALLEIELQIQMVKLEEEKEVLKQKKAETEKLIAQYEAEIAKADAQKQEALNRLDEALRKAELDEIKHKKALVDAQAELFKSMTGLADNVRTRVTTLYTAYINATKQVYTLQTRLLRKQAQLARIEAHLDSGADEQYNAIQDKKKEIAALESEIEFLEDMSYTAYSEAMEQYIELVPKYLAAMTEMEDAQVKVANAENIWIKFETETDLQPQFIHGWIPQEEDDEYVFGKVFQQWAANILEDKLTFKLLEEDDGIETPAKIWGYSDSDDNFVPLWKDEVKEYGPYYSYPESDGIYRKMGLPVYFQNLEGISPAIIFYDNFKVFFGDYKEDIEKDKQYYIRHSGIPEVEKEIEETEEALEQMREYIAKADETVSPAKNDMEKAEGEMKEALKVWNKAFDDIRDYIATGELHPEYVAYQEAINRYQNAKREDTFVDNMIVFTEGLFSFLEANITSAKEAQLAADEAVVAQQLVVSKKEEAITEAIVTAYTNAKSAVEDQKALIGTKFAAYQEKLDDANMKKLIWLADPDNTEKETAYNEAKEALAGAKEGYNTAVEGLATKENKLTEAKEAYDAVYNPYVEAKEVLEGLIVTATQKATRVVKAENALSENKETLAAYKAQKLLTAEAVVVAASNMAEKEEAWNAYATEENPEFKALADARDAASADYFQKLRDYFEAGNEFRTIKSSFDKYDYCVQELEETEEGTTAYDLARLNEQLIVLKKTLAENLESVDWLYSGYTNAEAELEQLKNVDEPVYRQWLAERVVAENAYYNAEKELIDVSVKFFDVMVQYEAIESIIVYVEVNLEGDFVTYNMEDYDKLIAGKKAELAKLNDELGGLIREFERGHYGETEQSKIEADIAEIEAKIEMYEALAETYWAELEYIMSGPIE